MSGPADETPNASGPSDETPGGDPPARSGSGPARKGGAGGRKRPASSAKKSGGAGPRGESSGGTGSRGSRAGGSKAGTPAAAGGARPAKPRRPRSPAKKPAAAGAEDTIGTADGATEQTAATQPSPARPPAPETPAAGSATASEGRTPGAVRRVLGSQRAPRVRTAVAVFLVVAALLGVMASALALWSRNLVFDTDAYVKVVAPVADDPAVRSSVAGFVAAKAVQAADLSDRLEAALPSAAKMTAPALTRALQQFLKGEIEKFLGTDVAKRLWVDVNRFAHQQLLSALRDQNRFVTVGREDVTLDLVPLIAVALQRLEEKVPNLLGKDVTLPAIDPSTAPQDIRTLLQDALGRELPADFGTVTLVHGSTGYELKQTLKLFNDLVIVVVVLTVALVVAALLVSVRRRRTALWLGLGALLAFAAARVLEVQLEKAVVGAIKSSGGAAVARSVLTAAMESLNTFFVWVAVAGAVVVVAAVLAGHPDWLRAMGRAFAELFGVASDLSTPDTRAGRWIHAHLDVLRVGGVAVAVVALLFVTASIGGVVAVVLALVVYELALTTYGVGLPEVLDATPDAAEAAGDGDPPAA